MAFPHIRGTAVQYLISCKTTKERNEKASEFSWKNHGETDAFLLIFRRLVPGGKRKNLSYKEKKEIKDS